MSFTWVQTIAASGNIEKVDIDEIRSNTDWLDNNIVYCTGHYGTYQATTYGTHLAVNYSSYLGSHFVSAYTNCPSDCDLADSAANVTYVTTANTSNLVDCTLYYSGDHAGWNSGYMGAAVTTDYSSDRYVF